jgi:hypothetical protein
VTIIANLRRGFFSGEFTFFDGIRQRPRLVGFGYSGGFRVGVVHGRRHGGSSYDTEQNPQDQACPGEEDRLR